MNSNSIQFNSHKSKLEGWNEQIEHKRRPAKFQMIGGESSRDGTSTKKGDGMDEEATVNCSGKRRTYVSPVSD